MPLTFSCPAGHTITCDDSFSGKPAKCPQCSSKFVVPPPGQPMADPLPKKEKPEGDESKDDEIVFLCPNGHKLNGPSRLQGKAGQCPECGAKFRIPTYEEGDEDDDDEIEDVEEILTGETVGDDEVFDADDLEEIEIVEDVEIAELPEDDYDYGVDALPEDAPLMDFVPTLPDFSEGNHALAGIFRLLWQQRQHGGTVEMQLAEGELLNPDYYSSELSQSTHGVFATQGKDGTFTIVSVPWDKVLRVTLRKTDDLPPGLFDS